MTTNPKHQTWIASALLAALFGVGCASEVSSSESDAAAGAAVVALTQVPTEVQCVRVTAAGAPRTERRPIDVSAGQSTAQVMFDRLPLGAVTFTAVAFSGACASAPADSQADWVSDPVLATLMRGQVAQVALSMKRNGRVAASIDFPASELGNVVSFRDDFTADLSPTDWATSFTAGAASVSVDTTNGTLSLLTVPNTGCATAEAHGLLQSSVADGTLTFESLVLDAYVDQSIYGDAQPRGLVAGTDRSNAIEFINAYPVPSHVTCRTVAGGSATETTVDIGQSVRSPADYKIVATSATVQFYVNGNLVATHTTNIPNVPLNVYYSTGDSCAGNVPVTVDWVSFQSVAE